MKDISWAEDSYELIIKSGTPADIIELIGLLEGYLEGVSQDIMKDNIE